MSTGNRVIPIFIVALLATLSTTVQGSVWQDGYGADKRGVAPSAGPLLDETAFEITLPGSPVQGSAPFIRDGKLYVLTEPNAAQDKNMSALFEVDLATGASRTLLRLAKSPGVMSADEDNLYIANADGLQAYAFAGVPAWRKPWNPPSFVKDVMWGGCSVVLRGESLYFACNATIGEVPCGAGLFLAKLGTRDGIENWLWRNHSAEAAGLPTRDYDCAPSNYLKASVIGEYAYVAAVAFVNRKDAETWWQTNSVFQLRDVDGELERVYHSDTGHRYMGLADNAQQQESDSFEHGVDWQYPAPTGTPDAVFLRMGEVVIVDPRTGMELFSEDYEQPDWARERGTGMAFDGQRLFFTSAQKLLALDVRDPGKPVELWGRDTPRLLTHEYWDVDGLTVSRGVLYAHSNLHLHTSHPLGETMPMMRDANNTHKFWAFDTSTGDKLWDRILPPSSLASNDDLAHLSFTANPWDDDDVPEGVVAGSEWRFTIGDGVLAAVRVTGDVLIIGRTAASIQSVLNKLDLFPALGEEIHVDLSASKPGVFGAATEFHADWGDGTVSDWQTSPVFTHAYNQTGRLDAKFELRNPKNQTAIEVVTFCVACPPPDLEERLQSLADDSGRLAATGQDKQNKGSWRDIWPVPLSVVGAALLLLVGVIPLATRRRGSLTAPRFRIESELGFGATSRVLLAHDTVLDRKVVLKQPLHPWLLERKGREQFLREAQILARLNHPNVVAIHEVLPHEEPPMLVLEYVPRGSLQDLLRNVGPLPPTKAIDIVDDVLAALEHVHDHGVIHRDIKPANVLIDEHDRGKLTDFNIATPPGDHTSTAAFTRQNNRAGSPSYMSPEQARGERLDIRTDLYSVGAVLYEALSGAHYLGDTATSDVALVEGIQHQHPVLPHRSIPPRLAVFLERALAKEPSARFANAAAMRKALADAARKIKPTLGSR